MLHRMLGMAVLLLGLAITRAHAQPIGGPFSLLDGNGMTVTDQAFQGRYLLVFFGTVNSPDKCPATLYRMARALALLGATPVRLQAVFITTDPARDTPDLASRYAALFSPDISGLSGTPDEIKRVTMEYHADAGQLIYLMGPDGRFVAAFPGDAAPAILAAKIAGAMAGN